MTERLPEDCEYVLIFEPRRSMERVYVGLFRKDMVKGDGYAYWATYGSGARVLSDGFITHWRPMPDPPKRSRVGYMGDIAGPGCDPSTL